MRKIIAALFVLLTTASVYGQEIVGSWSGALKVQGMELKLVFNISKSEGGYTSTMDSPNQGAMGIPTTSTAYENGKLKITVVNLGLEYEATLGNDGILNGTFKQGAFTTELKLTKEKTGEAQTKPRRPQEPVKPYPYYEEEVTFVNEIDNVKLAGTLTMPDKNGIYPAVVLISGSGAQDRNEEVMGHKPFLIIADHLTRNGIAVLRFDDRGVAGSTGDFKTATSFDFAKDAEAGLKYLMTRKEINPKKIGLAGHSEGGMIAPMIAARSKDAAFIMLLAGPGIRGHELLLMQQEALFKAAGADEKTIRETLAINKEAFDIVVQSTDAEQLKSELEKHLRKVLKERPGEVPANISEDDFIGSQLRQVATPWMQTFLKYDPAPALEKVKCPVLAINGSMDLQVPSKVNLEAIGKALAKGGNKNVTIKELAGLNHLFQECKTGLVSEYATIEQTWSPIALEEMSKWIKTVSGK